MDSERAKQIMKSKEAIQVLYRGSPVWLESVKENNLAEVTQLDGREKAEVPVYLLIEDKPVEKN